MTTKTATKTTKAKRKKRIPNMDSTSGMFFLCDRTPDPDSAPEDSGGYYRIHGPATYWHCWRLWCAMGGQRNEHLFISHGSDEDRALPIPQEFEGSEWDDLADRWEELVNADCRPLKYDIDPLEFAEWSDFYVCKDRAILFGPATYRDCLHVLKSECDPKAMVTHAIRMSRALPAPKTEAELEELLASHLDRPKRGERVDQLLQMIRAR